MQTMRRRQMENLAQASLQRFEDEMVEHSRAFAPKLCETIGEEQLRLAVHQIIERAESHGFSYRGPIRLMVEIMFLLGSQFDTDPQYAMVSDVLSSTDEQMVRAELLHARVDHYIEATSGPKNINVRNALESLSIFAKNPFVCSEDDFEPIMLREMSSIFPDKVAYIGQDALTALIQEAREAAKRYGFASPRAQALLVALMFAFGHGCTDDPLYPWISRTLDDARIANPEARAGRLEKKALTWLDHVLANSPQGAVV
jgi:hypothetical protein